MKRVPSVHPMDEDWVQQKNSHAVFPDKSKNGNKSFMSLLFSGIFRPEKRKRNIASG
ncbi:hypothetical protein LEP1GSC043_4777 [Leptospira weilii str. Ecochallenge]|uniref:Uncharacterized protein n=1 Tax=Leptospira weilii str. Ecochallenge TaxID=1049986 RepID=N1UC31_9LEPT|nr:hypothetical protein LEP1GSC043_4777 [Leptospira weilii str. Ecochallenge]